MQYIGPDYDENYGIFLPGLTTVLKPRMMSDGDIIQLLGIFPHLGPYFSEGTNTVTVPGTSNLGGDKHVVHMQTSPQTTWTIIHNMDKYPSVTVVDSGNSVIIGDVSYLSVNVLEVSFGFGFAGKAYLN